MRHSLYILSAHRASSTGERALCQPELHPATRSGTSAAKPLLNQPLGVSLADQGTTFYKTVFHVSLHAYALEPVGKDLP